MYGPGSMAEGAKPDYRSGGPFLDELVSKGLPLRPLVCSVLPTVSFSYAFFFLSDSVLSYEKAAFVGYIHAPRAPTGLPQSYCRDKHFNDRGGE